MEVLEIALQNPEKSNQDASVRLLLCHYDESCAAAAAPRSRSPHASASSRAAAARRLLARLRDLAPARPTHERPGFRAVTTGRDEREGPQPARPHPPPQHSTATIGARRRASRRRPARPRPAASPPGCAASPSGGAPHRPFRVPALRHLCRGLALPGSDGACRSRQGGTMSDRERRNRSANVLISSAW